jgi:hypothetical protein
MRDRVNVRRMLVLLEQGERLRAAIATTALRLVAVNLDLLSGLAAGLVVLQRPVAGDPARAPGAHARRARPARCAALLRHSHQSLSLSLSLSLCLLQNIGSPCRSRSVRNM